MSRNTNTRSNV